MIKIKSQTQPIENAEVFDVYSDSKKIVVCIVANEGFELVKEGEEPANIIRVDIPAMYEERVSLYKAIPWVEIPEEPEIPEVPEEPETQATETDYINALEELGVNFNE
jgi:hypothetical protein